MARARNIKPGLFKNELLGVADPLLTILFQSLWCLADKAGRLEDRPLRIKAETFPYRENIDVNVYLTELQRLGFISRYSVGSSAYIQVVNFAKHQNPHNTEKGSVIPDESMGCVITVRDTLNNGSRPADSLIPDSLIPDSLNLIPDPVEKVNPIVLAKAVTASGEAQSVFAYWQQKRGYQRAKLDAKRLKAINARLKDGYSVEDLCKAIDGISKSRHHMGENDNRKIYDDIELICRDGPKVDGFIKLAGAAPGLSPRLQNQIDVLNDWMNKP